MDKNELLKLRLPEADVEIPNVGTVRVRGLSRDEVFLCQKQTENIAKLERKMMAFALVNPTMSESEVGQWQINSTSGEIEPVMEKIHELSGLADDANKSSVSKTGKRS